MTYTTTIEITAEQKAQLDEIRETGQAYKHALQELIDGHSNTEGVDETEARRIAREEINELVTFKALE